MKTPRRTEPTPAAPLRTDDGGLLLSPPVCSSCRVRAVRVVAYTNASGEKAYRASTSCEECQRAAFGGGSPPAAPAVVMVPAVHRVCVYENPETSEQAGSYDTLAHALAHPAVTGAEIIQNGTLLATAQHGRWFVTRAAPISETRTAPRPITPLTSDETITALAASVDRVAPPPSVTAADLSRHAVRMRKAGMAPVTRDTCDPHERRFFSVGGGR